MLDHYQKNLASKKALGDALIEYCLKSDELRDKNIDHILNIGLCSFDELELIDEYSLGINTLRGIFYSLVLAYWLQIRVWICKKTKESHSRWWNFPWYMPFMGFKN